MVVKCLSLKTKSDTPYCTTFHIENPNCTEKCPGFKVETRKCLGKECGRLMTDSCNINMEGLVECRYVRGDRVDMKQYVRDNPTA